MSIWFQRFFTLITVGGGSLGLSAVITQGTTPGQPVLFYAFCLFAVICYAASIYYGLLLPTDTRKAANFLSWYFLIQCPIIMTPVIGYQLSTGVTTAVVAHGRGLSTSFYLGSKWEFALFQIHAPNIYIGLNIFAVWATWMLRRSLRHSSNLGAQEDIAKT
jgi:hypothetical protein